MPDSSENFVEICIGSLDDALKVARCGWTNIELNSALPLGGLTPSAGLVAAVLAETKLQVVAMVRPRPGGFCYSERDWHVLIDDAERLAEMGVQGLAFGVLNGERQIDSDRVLQLRRLLPHTKLVFHRAFDLVQDWRAGLEELIECGVDRVLTSGGHHTAMEGAENLREMSKLAGAEIQILAGGGITPNNCRQLIAETGVQAIHGSFSMPEVDVGYDDCAIRFGMNDALRVTDESQLLKLKEILRP